MVELKRLPVGLDDFKKIRKNQFYYVDKTKLIEQLLQNWSKVNLLTVFIFPAKKKCVKNTWESIPSFFFH